MRVMPLPIAETGTCGGHVGCPNTALHNLDCREGPPNHGADLGSIRGVPYATYSNSIGGHSYDMCKVIRMVRARSARHMIGKPGAGADVGTMAIVTVEFAVTVAVLVG